MKVHNLGNLTSQQKGGVKRTAERWLAMPALVATAKPGDRINIVVEDEYSFGSQAVNGLQIIGNGSTQKIILSGGQIEFRGNSVLANCTIKCTRVATAALAFSTIEPGTTLAVHNVVVSAPTRLRPGHPDVHVGRGTSMWAYGSFLGQVVVDGGRLHMSPSSAAANVTAINGGVVVKVPEFGQSAPQDGVTVGQGGQQLREPSPQPAPQQVPQPAPQPRQVQDPQPVADAERRDGPSNFSSLIESRKQAWLGRKKAAAGPSRPETNRSHVPQPRAPIGTIGHPGPLVIAGRAVTWKTADGHDWKNAIISQLEAGDTVQLEEGEYWIPGTMLNNIKFLGTGAPEHTVINVIDGTLEPCIGQSLTFSNLTIRGKAGAPAIANRQGRSMALRNVIVDHPQGAEGAQTAAIVAASGTTTMKNCSVRYDKYNVSGFMKVDSGGTLHATSSDLGFLYCARGVAELDDCSAARIAAANEGQVSVPHTLWLTNRGAADLFAIATETGGRIAAGQVVTQEKTTPIKAESGSTINIGAFIAPEGSEATTEELEDATIHVGGNPDQIRRTSGDQSLTRTPSTRTLDEALAELDAMVGQDEVKAQVRAMIAMTQLKKTRQERGLTSGDAKITQHFIFAGPPGTGKTSIARIIGDIYRALGALESGHVVEVDRSKLVFSHYGESAQQTNERVDEATGGVLLVDEAYSLQQKGYTGGDAAGKEVIDALLKRMEDDRGQFVVIATGYTEDMEEFLDSNAGLRDRFQGHIAFAHYSADELVQIVLSMVNSSGSRLSNDAIQMLHAAMQDIERRGLTQSRTFGNGRFARNLVARAEQEQAVRLSQLSNPSDAELTTLNAHDMQAALASEMRKLRP